jgi:hypothetical protein
MDTCVGGPLASSKKCVCSFGRIGYQAPPARSEVDVLDNGRVPRTGHRLPNSVTNLLQGVTQTIVVPEGTAIVDGGITTFLSPRSRGRKWYFPGGLSESVVGYDTGDRLLSSGKHVWKEGSPT